MKDQVPLWFWIFSAVTWVLVIVLQIRSNKKKGNPK